MLATRFDYDFIFFCICGVLTLLGIFSLLMTIIEKKLSKPPEFFCDDVREAFETAQLAVEKAQKHHYEEDREEQFIHHVAPQQLKNWQEAFLQVEKNIQLEYADLLLQRIKELVEKIEEINNRFYDPQREILELLLNKTERFPV